MKFDRWLQSKLASEPVSNFKADRAVEKMRRKSLRTKALVLTAVGVFSYLSLYDKPSVNFQEENFIASVFEEHELLIANSTNEIFYELLEAEH